MRAPPFPIAHVVMAAQSKNFTDLLHEAEQLTADIGGEEELPHVRRNIQQIAEAGQRLLSKTSGDLPKERAGKA